MSLVAGFAAVSRRWLFLLHAATGNRLKQFFDFWSTVHEIVIPEFVVVVFDELNECDEKTPWMRTVHDESFQEHSSYLLLDCFGVGFSKQVQQGAAEVMRVAVGVTELVCNSIQIQIPTLSVEIHCKILEDIHVGRMGDGRNRWCTTLTLDVCNSLSTNVENKSVH